MEKNKIEITKSQIEKEPKPDIQFPDLNNIMYSDKIFKVGRREEIKDNNFVTLFSQDYPVVTKSNIKNAIDNMIKDSSDSALSKYISFKVYEMGAKYAIENKELRNEAKKEFLEMTGGSFSPEDGIEVNNVKITAMSTEKKNMLSKIYEYSEEVVKMENELEYEKGKIKLLEDALKLRKVHEINSGTAKEITVDALFGQEEGKFDKDNVLNNFNLVLHFKQ